MPEPSQRPFTAAFTAAFADLTPRQRYKLLCGAVIPRPIALVTTVSKAGVVNAAPYSFFNVFSEDPALVVLGLQHRPDGEGGYILKDTTRNITDSGVFVVNMVDEALADAMNLTAIDFPPDRSEVDAAGLALQAGVSVPVPRLAAAPFALECRKQVSLAFGPQRELLIGEVVRMHARAGLVDEATMNIDFAAWKPVGRLFGDAYARQNDRFELTRETYAQWAARNPNPTEPAR
jgi:flavin reductase (DIM6/NTAB) family NADH-FMN oxidoreductase RutF